MAKTLHYDFLGRPALDGHDDYTSTPGTPDLALTRATTATMVDADGYIREVQAGDARFTGATFAHNIHKQSNDFSTSWVNTRTTDSQNVGTDPFGGTAAQSLNEDGTAASTHFINYNPGVILTAGKKYIHSLYAKASNRSWLAVVLSGGVSASGYWDVGNGVVGASGTHDDIFIEDVGNGWYRCSLVYTATSTNSNSSIYIGEGDGDVTFDGLSQESLLIYGVQVERATETTPTAAGTYVETTTVPVSSLSGTSTLGLKIEEARTNLCLQSEDFGTTWAPLNSTVDTNQTTSPDGSTTADLFKDDGGTTQKSISQTTQTHGSAAVVVQSVFAKAAGRNYIALCWGGFCSSTHKCRYRGLRRRLVSLLDNIYIDRHDIYFQGI
jgi:hypothetical protein